MSDSVPGEQSAEGSQPVCFYSDGFRIAADLYLPVSGKAGERHPAIVLCHGFGGLRRFWLPDFARFFAAAGYAVLAFDHRGTGDSEGPKASLNPFGQVADIRSAITYLETRSEVHAGQICLYGISYGGGNAAYAASVDSRAAAMACIVGWGNGERWLKSLQREWEWIEFKKRVIADRHNRVLTGQGEIADTSEILVRDPHSLEHEAAARAANPNRLNFITLESADTIMACKPEDFIHQVSPRPCLFVGVEEDTLVPTQEILSLYEKAREPKQLYLFPAIGHHAIYYGDELPKLLGMGRDFFDQALGRRS